MHSTGYQWMMGCFKMHKMVNLNIFFLLFLFVYVYEHGYSDQRRLSDPLELDLEEVMSHQT